MGAGVVLILWGATDAFFLARRNLSGYFIADRARARTFQYVLIVVGGAMALAGLVVG
nr:hypothetical protein [Actinomycetota bacterium]